MGTSFRLCWVRTVVWKGSGESHCQDPSQPMVPELLCLVPLGEARAPESLLLQDTPIIPVAQLPSNLSTLCSRSQGVL